MRGTRPFAEIAARLIWHRNLKGLDQKPYADKARITRGQLHCWETGKHRVSLDGALALRKAYGLSLDFLYTGDAETLPADLRAAWLGSPDVATSK